MSAGTTTTTTPEQHIAMQMPNNPKHKETGHPIPISLQFSDVRYKVCIKESSTFNLKKRAFCDAIETEKNIINSVSGNVMPGEMLALMGPSGSGKTTLINLLSGRLKHQSGNITYSGLPYSKALKTRMGFVTQDDVLYEHLTVKDTLMYAALLRLPKTMSTKEKKERAMEVIQQLGLEKCQDTVVGGPFVRGISGGERKRVCVGYEILTNPSLLFLDEPTSGLDSTTALRIVQVLHELSEDGRTIVTTIHQPSSRLFYMFDKLIILSEGQMLYFGKASMAMDYFSSIGFTPMLAMNPADFFLDLASGNHNGISIPDELDRKLHGDANSSSSKELMLQYLVHSYDTVSRSKEHIQHVENPQSSHGPATIDVKRGWTSSWCTQFTVLLCRGMKERRHENLSSMQVWQMLLIAIAAGCLWWHSNINNVNGLQDQIGLLFFISTYWAMVPLFSELFTFPQERAVLAKERGSDMYRLSAYFFSRIAGDTLLNLCLPFLFVLIVYFMANLKPTFSAFILTMLVIFLCAIVAQGFGLAIGAAVMNPKKAITTSSVFLLTFLLAGGYYVQNIPIIFIWLKKISFMYYVFDLLIKVQFSKDESYNCNTRTGCISIAHSPVILGTRLGSGYMEAMILLAMLLLFHFVSYLALRRMTNIQS